MENQVTRTCKQSRAIRSEILVARHMNDKETYYGGDIMSHFDSACGTSVYKFLRKPTYTATVDTLTFVAPAERGEMVYVESYVSGVGKTSVEVFVKLVANDTKNWERKLCAYAFLTFVLADRNDPTFQMPVLVPETEEEIMIYAGYEERRKENLAKRKNQQSLIDNISIVPPWE